MGEVTQSPGWKQVEVQLLARSASYESDARRSRDAVLAELAHVLDDLEARFPHGRPPKDDVWARLDFAMLDLKRSSCLSELRWLDEDEAGEPRRLRLIRGGLDDAE